MMLTAVSKHGILPVTALLFLGSVAFMHLMALPVFEDEGSQLRRIWRVMDEGEWLQPLDEGKPLEVWPMVPLASFAPQPLAAIRALHVLAGVIGAVLMYSLAGQVTDRGTAFASGVLFAVCPFVVHLQRLALSDIFLCTASIWVLLSVIKLVRSPTWPGAAALAVALVLAALSKLPVGFVFLTSMPLALLLMPAPERRALLQPPAFAKVFAAHGPAALLALLVIAIAIIRTYRGQSPGFGLQDLIGIGLGRYEHIAAVIGVPRPSLIGELTAQLSWPVVALGLIGLAASALLNDWRQRWLIAVGAAPTFAIGWFAGFWYSRYLLFALPPLIVGAASGWHSLARRARRFPRAVEFAALAVCLGFMGVQSARIVFDPAAARWSPLDRFQYFEGWGSGYGYPEAAQFLLQTPDAPLMVYSLDGHSAYQLRTYLPKEWSNRVQPVFYGQNGEALRSEKARLANLLSHTRAWIVVPEQLLQGYIDANFGGRSLDQIKLRQIAEFPKPGSRAQLAIYEVARR
jgi:hypothetical protein